MHVTYYFYKILTCIITLSHAHFRRLHLGYNLKLIDSWDKIAQKHGRRYDLSVFLDSYNFHMSMTLQAVSVTLLSLTRQAHDKYRMGPCCCNNVATWSLRPTYLFWF